MGSLGAEELYLIILFFLVLFIVFFGIRLFPAIMRALGKGVREYKDAKSDVKENNNVNTDEK